MPLPRNPDLILCYVTDRRALSPAAEGAKRELLLEKIRQTARAGVDWIQIREKDLPARALCDLVRSAVDSAEASRILVNDRLDVGIAAGAAGVHLSAESLPVAEVTRWCRAGNAPAGFLVGRSCHSLEEAAAAERDGADYVVFGPVFATPSKLAYGPPQGVEKLAEVCGAVRIPVVAIGGITPEKAAECARAGARGIAAIRMFQEAFDAAEVVSRLRAAV